MHMLSEWRQFSQITNFLHGLESNLSTISLDSNHILSFIVLLQNSNFESRQIRYGSERETDEFRKYLTKNKNNAICNSKDHELFCSDN